jgi:hypothetical protein
MPFPPPPPPPGPPAPTFGSGGPQTSHSDGEGRNILLQSIRQGTTLKKTVTNDRSSPVIGKFSSLWIFFRGELFCSYSSRSLSFS